MQRPWEAPVGVTIPEEYAASLAFAWRGARLYTTGDGFYAAGTQIADPDGDSFRGR